MLALLTFGIGCTATPAPKSSEASRQPSALKLEASLQRALDSGRPATLYNEPTAPRERIDLDGLRFVGMDDGPVPDFSVETYDGVTLDSHDLIGQEPFVVVFFATWCQVCDLKMPVLKQVTEELGPVKTILVSVDGEETWPHVPGYLKEHHVKFPVVSAQAFPRFSASYNPFQAVPLVVVVGQNGGLVDYQMGFSENHGKRLGEAIQLARTVGPLKASGHRGPVHTLGTPSGAKEPAFHEQE